MTWRIAMHSRLRRHPGMRAKLAELLEDAWKDGRSYAVEQPVAESDFGAETEKNHRRAVEAHLPQECPYSLVDVAGYDPYDKKARPDPEAWPPSVALALNEELGTTHHVRHGSRGPDRDWRCQAPLRSGPLPASPPIAVPDTARPGVGSRAIHPQPKQRSVTIQFTGVRQSGQSALLPVFRGVHPGFGSRWRGSSQRATLSAYPRAGDLHCHARPEQARLAWLVDRGDDVALMVADAEAANRGPSPPGSSPGG